MTALLLVVAVALAVSFVCSILEAVLLSVSHGYVAVLQDRGDPLGDQLARMRAKIEEPIAAILTLNTIAHTVGAAVAGAMAAEVFGSRWLGLFSAVLTLIILVFSEILPKTLGATFWQSLVPFSVRVLLFLSFVMKPILVPLAWFNRLITPRGVASSTVSRAELEVLAGIGRREGALDQEEWQVMTNVMNLDEVSVGQVMTPRTQAVAISISASVDAAQEMMLEEGHLRLPVFEGTIDNVVGVLIARDLWRAAREGVKDLREIVRPTRYVPESKSVEELIREMRHQRIKMAIVLDEYGGTAGLVTLEDLIEEIVGEIQDEHEIEPLPFEEEMEGEVRIHGSVPLPEVNDRFGLSLPSHLHETIGGYVFGTLGRVAQVGDEVEIPGGTLRVLAMDGRRIDRIAYTPDPSANPSFTADSD